MKLPAFMLAGCLALAACSSSAGESIAGLGLSGRLVYTQGQEGLWQIDLKSGEIQQLWRLPEGGQLTGVAVSPDGLDLALSYAPPRGDSPFLRSDLYLADGDGSNLAPLLEHRGLYETFDYPTWSPDGQRMALMHLGGLFVTTGGEPVFLTETPNHGGLDWSED